MKIKCLRGKFRISSFTAIVLAILLVAAGAVVHFEEKRSALIETCKLNHGVAQDALAACDTLLRWGTIFPITRSLVHHHKLRAYMQLEDWDAATEQADLAIAEFPHMSFPWHLKAQLLDALKDYDSALSTIDEALRLHPDDKSLLRAKYDLFTKLEDYASIDEMVSRVWENEESADWLPNDEYQNITWNPERFPKSQAVFLKVTLKAKDELIGDLANTKLRTDFLLHCRLLAANCPPLFPENRASYPNIACDEAVEDFERLYPDDVEKFLNEVGYQTVIDFIRMEPFHAAQVFQWLYFGSVRSFVLIPSPQASRDLITAHNVMECLSDEEFIFPADVYGGVEQAMRDAENQFGKQVRLNLLDLAYVAVN